MNTFHESKTPTQDELNEMTILYNNLKNISLFQFPENNFDISSKNFFYVKDSFNKIKAYCIVRETNLKKLNFLKTANIYFGVISLDDNLKNDLLQFIIKSYKSKKFAEIFIYYLNEYFVYKINQKKIKLDNLERGTLIIDLKIGLEKIQNNYSKHLKRNLKKGLNLNLIVKELDFKFSENAYEIYELMSKKREIDFVTKSEFLNLYKYSQKNGFCLGCFFNEKLIGGMFCIIQGNRIEYFIGFTDPNHKHLPQSHLTFDKAIELSCKLGLEYFDMGGAVKDIDDKNQIFNINKFKYGFTKNFINYQPSIKFDLNKIMSLLKYFYLKTHELIIK